jgi:hypothetical protein
MALYASALGKKQSTQTKVKNKRTQKKVFHTKPKIQSYSGQKAELLIGKAGGT